MHALKHFLGAVCSIVFILKAGAFKLPMDFVSESAEENFEYSDGQYSESFELQDNDVRKNRTLPFGMNADFNYEGPKIKPYLVSVDKRDFRLKHPLGVWNDVNEKYFDGESDRNPKDGSVLRNFKFRTTTSDASPGTSVESFFSKVTGKASSPKNEENEDNEELVAVRDTANDNEEKIFVIRNSDNSPDYRYSKLTKHLVDYHDLDGDAKIEHDKKHCDHKENGDTSHSDVKAALHNNDDGSSRVQETSRVPASELLYVDDITPLYRKEKSMIAVTPSYLTHHGSHHQSKHHGPKKHPKEHYSSLLEDNDVFQTGSKMNENLEVQKVFGLKPSFRFLFGSQHQSSNHENIRNFSNENNEELNGKWLPNDNVHTHNKHILKLPKDFEDNYSDETTKYSQREFLLNIARIIRAISNDGDSSLNAFHHKTELGETENHSIPHEDNEPVKIFLRKMFFHKKDGKNDDILEREKDSELGNLNLQPLQKSKQHEFRTIPNEIYFRSIDGDGNLRKHTDDFDNVNQLPLMASSFHVPPTAESSFLRNLKQPPAETDAIQPRSIEENEQKIVDILETMKENQRILSSDVHMYLEENTDVPRSLPLDPVPEVSSELDSPVSRDNVMEGRSLFNFSPIVKGKNILKRKLEDENDDESEKSPPVPIVERSILFTDSQSAGDVGGSEKLSTTIVYKSLKKPDSELDEDDQSATILPRTSIHQDSKSSEDNDNELRQKLILSISSTLEDLKTEEEEKNDENDVEVDNVPEKIVPMSFIVLNSDSDEVRSPELEAVDDSNDGLEKIVVEIVPKSFVVQNSKSGLVSEKSEIPSASILERSIVYVDPQNVDEDVNGAEELSRTFSSRSIVFRPDVEDSEESKILSLPIMPRSVVLRPNDENQSDEDYGGLIIYKSFIDVPHDEKALNIEEQEKQDGDNGNVFSKLLIFRNFVQGDVGGNDLELPPASSSQRSVVILNSQSDDGDSDGVKRLTIPMIPRSVVLSPTDENQIDKHGGTFIHKSFSDIPRNMEELYTEEVENLYGGTDGFSKLLMKIAPRSFIVRNSVSSDASNIDLETPSASVLQRSLIFLNSQGDGEISDDLKRVSGTTVPRAIAFSSNDERESDEDYGSILVHKSFIDVPHSLKTLNTEEEKSDADDEGLENVIVKIVPRSFIIHNSEPDDVTDGELETSPSSIFQRIFLASHSGEDDDEDSEEGEGLSMPILPRSFVSPNKQSVKD